MEFFVTQHLGDFEVAPVDKSDGGSGSEQRTSVFREERGGMGRGEEQYPDVIQKQSDVKLVNSLGRRGQRSTPRTCATGIIEIGLCPGNVVTRLETPPVGNVASLTRQRQPDQQDGKGKSTATFKARWFHGGP